MVAMSRMHYWRKVPNPSIYTVRLEVDYYFSPGRLLLVGFSNEFSPNQSNSPIIVKRANDLLNAGACFDGLYHPLDRNWRCGDQVIEKCLAFHQLETKLDQELDLHPN